jgi:hypothetical protein
LLWGVTRRPKTLFLQQKLVHRTGLFPLVSGELEGFFFCIGTCDFRRVVYTGLFVGPGEHVGGDVARSGRRPRPHAAIRAFIPATVTGAESIGLTGKRDIVRIEA